MAINDLYTLEQIQMIGGNTQYLDYSVYDPSGSAVDLNGATCEIKLRRYGSFGSDAFLTKTGTITGTNTFQVILSTADTLSLYGKFTQQVIVTDMSSKQFRFMGLIVIEKSIT